MTKTMYVTEVISECEIGVFALSQAVNPYVLDDILDHYCSIKCNTDMRSSVFEADSYKSCIQQGIDEGLPLDDLYAGDLVLGLHWTTSGFDEDVSKAVNNFISNTSDSERKEFEDCRKSFLKLCSQSFIENDVADLTNLDKQSPLL